MNLKGQVVSVSLIMAVTGALLDADIYNMLHCFTCIVRVCLVMNSTVLT